MMLPSVSNNVTTSALEPYGKCQTSPLTTDRVIRNSHLKSDGGLTFRTMNHLSWFENENIASCNGRIDFINQVTSKIVQEIPSRNSPITLISLGSAGLLTEFFIHEQLKKAGYEDISWRVIDTDYKNNGFKKSLHAFDKQVKSNCKSFMTEQEYLNASSGNIELAENDKYKGNIVVLSIDPPTELTKFSDGYQNPELLLVKGKTVDKIGDANEICLITTGHDSKNELSMIPVALSKPGQMVRLDSLLKCSINKSGGCDVSHSKSARGYYMYNGVKPYLDKLCSSAVAVQKEVKLDNIKKVFDMYIKNISDKMSGLSFLVSDYDVAIANIHDYFIDSNKKVLFASFEKNEISFERKNNQAVDSFPVNDLANILERLSPNARFFVFDKK